MLLPMIRDRPAWLCLPLALAVILMMPVRGGAQATPYVPNLDPVYQDLDGLIAAGWVRTAIAGLRPYSRLTVARLVVEARAYSIHPSRIQHLKSTGYLIRNTTDDSVFIFVLE